MRVRVRSHGLLACGIVSTNVRDFISVRVAVMFVAKFIYPVDQLVFFSALLSVRSIGVGTLLDITETFGLLFVRYVLKVKLL